MDYANLLDKLVTWCEKVGAYQLSKFRSPELGFELKSSDSDWVTEVDKASEKMLLEFIQTNCPEHTIISEETGLTKGEDKDHVWHIDPLDGTMNYAQGLPIFCISIGLQHKGQTQLGLVYAPYLREFYKAVKGQGAFLNDQEIKVSDKKNIGQNVVATGFPHAESGDPTWIRKFGGIRRFGSAAYDLSCVASGTLDAYWEPKLHSWDVVAGQLLVEEAGGQVRVWENGPKLSIVAGQSMAAAYMLEQVGQ